MEDIEIEIKFRGDGKPEDYTGVDRRDSTQKPPEVNFKDMVKRVLGDIANALSQRPEGKRVPFGIGYDKIPESAPMAADDNNLRERVTDAVSHLLTQVHKV